MRRGLAASALFIVCEYGLWIAMLVYAYHHGGATSAGLVAVAQQVPATVVAPLVGTMADRRSPVAVLRGGYAVQAVGSAATAGVLFAGLAPVAAYAGAVLVSTAIAATRPAQSALLPALTRHVEELTAADVVVGWVESLGILVAGVGTGLALAFGTVGHVFAAAAILLAAAALLVAPLRRLALDRRANPAEATGGLTGGSLTLCWRDRPARLLVGLIGAEHVFLGALDVLFVVLAIDLLDAGQAWTGYLNTAFGAGALQLGSMGAFLVGRRVGPVIVTSALALAAVMAATAVANLPWVVVLLAVVGGSRTLFDVAVRVLLQRVAAPELLGRLFGLAEGLSMAGLAVGSILSPALVALGGAQVALVGAACVLPVAVLTRVLALYHLDQAAHVPVVEISLLRQLAIFRTLPGTALEGLAHALEKVGFHAGSELMREGDEGDSYFAIVEGTVDVRRHGRSISTLERGDGLGEIALLRSVPRTATAVATTPVSAYRLDRDDFLTAVNGHVPTLQSADRVVRETRARDASRDAARPPR